MTEFLRKEYPTTPYSTNVRLGSIPLEFVARPLTSEQARQLSRLKRYCDAVIFLPDRTIIVEAKMRAEPGIVTLLALYRRLFKETPDLRERWGLPLEMMLLYAVEDPVTIEFAREVGIRAVQYRPEWIEEWLASVSVRKREATLTSVPGGV